MFPDAMFSQAMRAMLDGFEYMANRNYTVEVKLKAEKITFDKKKMKY